MLFWQRARESKTVIRTIPCKNPARKASLCWFPDYSEFLITVFLCPKSHAAEAEKMLYIKRSLRHSQCIKRDSRRIATVLQKIVVRILLQIVSLSVMIYKLEF